MSISLLVEIGNGDKRSNDISNNLINSFDIATKYGKKHLYDTRTKKNITFDSKYKSITPNDLININDNIIGNKKCIVTKHSIRIQNGIVTSSFQVETDYE